MHIHNKKSLSRFLRQLIFIPTLHNRWLNTSTKERLANAIMAAETGHQGEIFLIIEEHLPLYTAYQQGCLERAVDLFGLYKVWDTENNTGILIYLNLCEHDLEIIADRGINQKAQDNWQPLCDMTLNAFKQGHFEQGLLTLIESLGTILKTHYPDDDNHGNELPNHPIHLR